MFAYNGLPIIGMLCFVQLSQTYACCITAPMFKMAELRISESVVYGEEANIVAYNSRLQMIVKTGKQGVKVIKDFKSMTEYVVTLVTGHCKKSNLIGHWTGWCLPAGSKKIQTEHYGSDDKPLVVDLYDLGSTDILMSTMTVTSEECIPVVGSTRGNSKQGSLFIGNEYSNFTEKVDPSVFYIPSNCI